MKYSNDFKDIYKSGGGVVAITILIILVVFAIFTSSGSGFKLSQKTGGNLEDFQEQQREQLENQNENPRNFIVKDGQKLVIF